MQDALIAAANQWPLEGLPDNPRAWLIHVATRRMTDRIRSERARLNRETAAAAETPFYFVPSFDPESEEQDDTLVLLFMCCHPVLTPASAIALTLRAVGGLTTAEIASAFLVPESTMAQRITRAKGTIKSSEVRFQPPSSKERAERLRSVLHVLYLIFNEGYTSSAGPELQRLDLSAEAIRLARATHALLPEDTEVAGLLALMLLTDARRPARTGPAGEIIPLDQQDRSLWNQARHPGRHRAAHQCAARKVPSAVTHCRPPSPLCTTKRPAPKTLTGRRSSPSTSSSSACRTIPWSCSTTRSPPPWSMAPLTVWICSTRSTKIRASPITTASTPFARTCTNWPAIPPPQSPTTSAAAQKTASIPERNYLLTQAARLAETRRERYSKKQSFLLTFDTKRAHHSYRMSIGRP